MADTKTAPGRKGAGLFDLRLIIGVLFIIYGLVLTVMGIAGNSQADQDKTGGININLWMGIAMIVVAVLFGLWAMLRPVVMPPEGTTIEADDAGTEG